MRIDVVIREHGTMDTLHWIHWLLERGWTIRPLRSAVLKANIWVWRTPGGVSGDDYQSTDFYTLPPAVEAHVLEHAIIES